ncbi:MAG: hypothetical protein QOD75_1049 [Blastocatellia bacterium]|jgi:hypothetical protein|nr:hypothetical protein [Blastocatellia bacterium]
MKLRKPFLLLIALLLAAAAASAQTSTPAQTSKQELNDQFWEAARKGDAAAVTALLDKGADVNARFRYGTTALFKAAERGNIEVVKVLLARGADVTVKDTFYQTTAMTWALDNKHFDVVRALLEKDAAAVDDILTAGTREGNAELVRLALDRGGAKAETLTAALALAASDVKTSEIADMLRKAGAKPPVEVSAETLQSYVGTYRGDPGPEIAITLKDRTLLAGPAGQPPLPLMAIDQTSFRPVTFGGLTLIFKIEGGKVTGFALKQGPNTTQLKRVE